MTNEAKNLRLKLLTSAELRSIVHLINELIYSGQIGRPNVVKMFMSAKNDLFILIKLF